MWELLLDRPHPLGPSSQINSFSSYLVSSLPWGLADLESGGKHMVLELILRSQQLCLPPGAGRAPVHVLVVEASS